MLCQENKSQLPCRRRTADAASVITWLYRRMWTGFEKWPAIGAVIYPLPIITCRIYILWRVNLDADAGQNWKPIHNSILDDGKDPWVFRGLLLLICKPLRWIQSEKVQELDGAYSHAGSHASISLSIPSYMAVAVSMTDSIDGFFPPPSFLFSRHRWNPNN